MERVRQITRVNEAHKLGYIGNNVTVAVMDTGIGTHIDFGQRIRGFRDYVGDKKILYDDNGHGTHVSGIIAGSGFASHGRYRGMAPGAAIYAIKVLDRMGKGNTRLVVSALKWLIANYEKMNIRILNISVGIIFCAVVRSILPFFTTHWIKRFLPFPADKSWSINIAPVKR